MTAAAPVASHPLSAALAALRPGLFAVAGVSAAISVLMLTGSIYMLQVYDRVLASGSVPTLIVLFSVVVVLHGFLAFYDGLRMRLLSRTALQLDSALAPVAFRAGLTAADPGGQALRDLDAVRATLGGPAMLALFDLPFTLLFLAVLFLIHPVLGGLTLGGMAVAAVLAFLNHRRISGPAQAALTADATARALAERARRAAPTLAALGMGNAVAARWQAAHDRALAAQQTGGEPSEMLAALSRAFRMLLQSALLTAAAWLVIGGAISSGAIVASSILSGRALAPVDQLIGQWKGVAAARTAMARLRVVLSALPATPAVALPAPQGALSVTGLTRLAPARPGTAERAKLLDGVGFTLAAGEGLGVVGASASGKSTLARMLVGAAAPDAGEVRLDGATYDQWDPSALGRHIGYLPQQVDLLPGTVRDNIARFDPAATDADVIAAAEAAGVHAMILALPQGYATEVGHAEQPLSGGQLQRIGLARALYGRPRLLVLDEPNAHLDMAGEAALTRALRDLRAGGSTVVVMAHRAGALAAVDRLMVLEGGRVVQDGPRDAVLSHLGGRSKPVPVPRPSYGPARAAAPDEEDDEDLPQSARGPAGGLFVARARPAATPAAAVAPVARRLPGLGDGGVNLAAGLPDAAPRRTVQLFRSGARARMRPSAGRGDA